MVPDTSLVSDAVGGEQIVRRPRATDAIGATLRDGFAVRPTLPADMRRLLDRLRQRR